MTSFCSVPEAIEEIRAGRLLIVVDDEDRENEGDFIMAAELVTPKAINFMARHGRGLICVSITEQRAKELDLPLMVRENTTSHNTNFTVSVDHIPTTTTGISAADRANTIFAITDERTKASDLARPGHIFPLISRKGGVLRRAGHTEASSDLAALAGLHPAGILCEILKENGDMARTPELSELARLHGIKMLKIEDLIKYRKQTEMFVDEESVVRMPTSHGTFMLHLFVNKHQPSEHHLALVKGNVSDGKPVLVRVHSECLTGDVLGSKRCDCGEQLHTALDRIEKEGRGVLLYLRQEGRGIGLPAKIKAYALQEQGADTVEANVRLGYKADLRDYGFGAQMLLRLGVRSLRLMTNNPRKIVALKGYDLEIVERVPLEIASHAENKDYLRTKRDKLGHLLMKDDSRI